MYSWSIHTSVKGILQHKQICFSLVLRLLEIYIDSNDTPTQPSSCLSKQTTLPVSANKMYFLFSRTAQLICPGFSSSEFISMSTGNQKFMIRLMGPPEDYSIYSSLSLCRKGQILDLKLHFSQSHHIGGHISCVSYSSLKFIRSFQI